MVFREDIKGLIFDYGGTLDTGGDHWGQVIWHAYQYCMVPVDNILFREAYVYAERELARNPIIQPSYTFKKTLSVKLRIEMEYISRHNNMDVDKWHHDVLNCLYSKTCMETAKSQKVLTMLKKHYPMVLVSNFYGNISTVLYEFCFDGLFDKIIESAVVGIRKPDSRIFALGVEALNLQSQDVVVIGDSYTKDIMPAKSIGCDTVWIKGEGWTSEDETSTNAADSIITDIRELF